jgi:hypothetical protein
MSSVIISGDTSGAITVSAPAVAGTNTLTLQAATATNAINTLATAVASTSGTSIDFTGLPSWIKRVTVMFAGVSTSGTSNILIQSGSGSFDNTGYVSQSANRGGEVSSTAGFLVTNSIVAASLMGGSVVLTTLGSNIWSQSGAINGGGAGSGIPMFCAGYKTFSGTIDRIRITTVGGTETFDAGTINILYEG